MASLATWMRPTQRFAGLMAQSNPAKMAARCASTKAKAKVVQAKSQKPKSQSAKPLHKTREQLLEEKVFQTIQEADSLSPPPTRPSGQYALFIRDFMAKTPANPIQGASMKEAAARYRTLSDAEKQQYQRQADALKAKYDQDVAAYEARLTEKQRLAYAYRKASLELERIKAKLMQLHRAELPPQPKNAYQFFVEEFRQGLSATEASHLPTYSKLASATWNKMTESQKKPYAAMAQKQEK